MKPDFKVIVAFKVILTFKVIVKWAAGYLFALL